MADSVEINLNLPQDDVKESTENRQPIFHVINCVIPTEHNRMKREQIMELAGKMIIIYKQESLHEITPI